MTHSLTLGSALLTDGFPDDDHGFVFNVLAEGAGFGAASSVQEIVTSLLSDGDLVKTRRYGNREVSFAVEITGPSLGALAYGEAALRGEVGRPNTLTWEAPDILSVPTVFEVLTSEMSQTFDDLDELRHRRIYVLKLICSPHALSAEPVTVPALVAGTSTVTVDTCDVTTGWTGQRNGSSMAPTTFWEAGSVAVAELDNATGYPPETWTLIRTGAVDFTSTPYLVAELRVIGSDNTLVSCVADRGLATERVLPLLEARKMVTGAHSRLTWDATGAGVVSTLTFSHTTNLPTQRWQGLFIRLLNRTDVAPGVTIRQLTRVIEPGGTERTPASLHIQSVNGTAALDHVVAHTCPEDGSGYSPPLQRWRTVGQTRTTDATAFSGNYELINVTSWVAEVPTSSLPEGGYSLVARMRAQVAATVRVSWSTSTIFPDSTTQQGFTLGQEDVDFPPDQEWIIVPLAVLSLPSVRTKAGRVQVALQVEAATPSVTLDEAWLFREGDDCATTIVKTARPHLWLDSPEPSSPAPTVWVGDGLETKVHPGEGLIAQGSHVLSAEGTALFTAALTDNPKADATFFRRWHSNAAE